jgi:hypothetical protein
MLRRSDGDEVAVGYWLLAIGFAVHWTGAHKMRPYRLGRCALNVVGWFHHN